MPPCVPIAVRESDTGQKHCATGGLSVREHTAFAILDLPQSDGCCCVSPSTLRIAHRRCIPSTPSVPRGICSAWSMLGQRIDEQNDRAPLQVLSYASPSRDISIGARSRHNFRRKGTESTVVSRWRACQWYPLRNLEHACISPCTAGSGAL